MQKFQFTLTGLTDLLMHHDNIPWSDELGAWRKDSDNKDISVKGDDRSPAWTWLGSLYHDGAYLAIPADNFLTCLRSAGATVQIPGKRNKTYKELTQSGLVSHVEFLSFTVKGKRIALNPLLGLKNLGSGVDVFPRHQEAASDHGFSLYVKRAKIGQSKHVRVRPRFGGWMVAGEMTVCEPDALTPDVLARIFDIAGKKGLGDWRPGGKTPGTFGQFRASLKSVE